MAMQPGSREIREHDPPVAVLLECQHLMGEVCELDLELPNIVLCSWVLLPPRRLRSETQHSPTKELAFGALGNNYGC